MVSLGELLIGLLLLLIYIQLWAWHAQIKQHQRYNLIWFASLREQIKDIKNVLIELPLMGDQVCRNADFIKTGNKDQQEIKTRLTHIRNDMNLVVKRLKDLSGDKKIVGSFPGGAGGGGGCCCGDKASGAGGAGGGDNTEVEKWPF